nr:reverse transcriptase domain-containing protein [Tanacetum cinerariifolium]
MNNNHNQEPPPHNGPPPMVRPNGQAPRTMEELCQPSINEQGGPIALIPIQATDFGLRHHMIQQVQNTCQFHGLPGDDANRNIDKFLEITQHMKQNRVSDDALLTQIDTFYNGLTLSHRDTINATAGGSFMQKTPEECYELIENTTAHHNHWDTSVIRDETSRNISSISTTESPEHSIIPHQLEVESVIDALVFLMEKDHGMDHERIYSSPSAQHNGMIEIGSGLKKIFEDGVVKREENLHPILEVEIARHAYRGNWRREKQKKRIAGFEDVKIEADDASVEQAEHNAGSVLGSAPVDKPAKHNP